MNSYVRVKELYAEPIDMTIVGAGRNGATAIGSSYDPEIFGPSLWFVLHNAATSYPEHPTTFIRSSMKQLLINLPLLVPCITPCREHFYAFLRASDLDAITKSKEHLFKFLVNLHNYVNVRYGKQAMSLDAAKEFYGYDRPDRGASVKITYK